MTGTDFRPLICRRVLVVGITGGIIGAGGTTTVEAVDGDVVFLKTGGKAIVRPADARKLAKVSTFADDVAA